MVIGDAAAESKNFNEQIENNVRAMTWCFWLDARARNSSTNNGSLSEKSTPVSADSGSISPAVLAARVCIIHFKCLLLLVVSMRYKIIKRDCVNGL
jgi:hypothetical protein